MKWREMAASGQQAWRKQRDNKGAINVRKIFSIDINQARRKINHDIQLIIIDHGNRRGGIKPSDDGIIARWRERRKHGGETS